MQSPMLRDVGCPLARKIACVIAITGNIHAVLNLRR